MTPIRRPLRTLAAGAAVLALLATVGCAESDGDGAEVLHVYSGRHYDVEKAFEQFQSETGIEVEFLTGNDAELRERIAAEGSDTEADVYLTVDAGNLAQAAADGLFQPMDSPDLEAVIDEQYRDPDGLWYALALRARTIIYNPDLIDEADVPTTYEELAEPEWKGRVCMRNAANGYQQSLVASLIAQHGHDETLEVVEGWADNAEIFANDVEIIEAVDAEACEVAVANHYYLARAIDEDPDLSVDLIWANQGAGGTHVNISGGGITKYADHPELAQQFLEWLGTDGQGVLVDGNFELPANTTVEPVQLVVDEFGVDFERQDIPATEIGELNPEAVEIMDEANFG
ncbi:MAG: extracellular solute-binding protein [Acidimicrobiales bacterium]|nr:extracellular solute-binding protein [Acidimicrobiales bacterium]